MTDTIETHRQTALDSPYSQDRKEAIEELERVYPNVPSDEQLRIIETFRQIAVESASRRDRDLAQELLVDCFDADPTVAQDVAVPCFVELAQESKFSEERCSAIDTLRRLYPDVDDSRQKHIGQTLTDIAENGTYDDERRRARRRLTDITTNKRSNDLGRQKDPKMIGYLAESLTEHLTNAAKESPEACQQRAQELYDFVVNTPVDDKSYTEVRNELEELVDQLAHVPTDDTLGNERIERVQRVALRVKQLYNRSVHNDK